MAVVCDTGAVYALYDADDQHHDECKAVISSERGPFSSSSCRKLGFVVPAMI